MSREVDAIVNNVSAQLDTPSKKAESQAYQLLADEIHNLTETQGVQAATEIGSQVLHKLEQEGKLPHLSIGWARANYDQINIHKDDGGLSAGEIARYTSQSGSPQAMLNSVMADRMLRQNEDGSTLFHNVADRSPNSLSAELIEMVDLRAYGRQERRHDRREAKHDQVLQDAARLLEGAPPLMAVLDASADGKADGRVSMRDMKRFLVQYDVNQQTDNRGQHPYTPENAQFVSELLEGKYPHITGDNFTGFSAEALARRAGLDKFIVHHAEDYAVLAQRFQEKLQAKQAQPGEEFTPEQPAQEPEREADAPAERPEAPPVPDARECAEIAEGTFDQIKDMCKFRPGEGYWHVAKRLLNAGFPAEDRASDREILMLTKTLMALSNHSLDDRGRPRPMVHPGELAIDLSGSLPKLGEKIPRLVQSLRNLHKVNMQVTKEVE